MDILNALLNERSVSSALSLLKQRLEDIAEHRIPLDKFVLSKQIKSFYATDSIVHAAAWRRMRDRGDEGLPPIGARMPFLITAADSARGVREDSKLYERAEHPAYVAKAQLTIDYVHYIRSLENPMIKLLQFSSTEVQSIFKDSMQRAHLRVLGIGSLLSFANKNEESSTSFTNGLSGGGAPVGLKRSYDSSIRKTSSKKEKLEKGGGMSVHNLSAYFNVK
jgi:hypothetical protein